MKNPKRPLPKGTVISYSGIHATVIKDSGLNDLLVELFSGHIEKWYWKFGGVECEVVSYPKKVWAKRILAPVVVFLAALSVFGCTKPDTTTRVLSENGYTDIEITGYSLFSCSEQDVFSTGFRAKSPSGHDVKGAVCSGLFKGNTIRLK